MRWFLLATISIFWALLPVSMPEALSQEALTVRVISLDHDQGAMIVEPVSTGSYPERITVHYDPEQAPPRLSPQDIIRIQGFLSPDGSGQFTASHIGYGKNTADPTGVRSRIGKCRGQGYRGGKGQEKSWRK